MIFECDFKEWRREMIDRILKCSRFTDIVAVYNAGFSASGKGETTKQLKADLENRGKRVCLVSMDDFYKGISRLIIEKMPNRVCGVKIDKADLIKFVKRVTGGKEFLNKFTEENLFKIKLYLEKKYPGIYAERAVNFIKEESGRIDVDNPAAVNLRKFSQAISQLRKRETVVIPEYSMKTGERTGFRAEDGGDYDVILAEGLYVLNKIACPIKTDSKGIYKNGVIKSYIEADSKTLLMRRLRRDILSGRSTFPPEINLWMILEIVLPASKKYILPDREKADLILKNDYTGLETFDTPTYDVQDKIPVYKNEIPELKKKWTGPIETAIQEDYYFINEEAEHDPHHLLRIRVENGKLKNLVHKGIKIEREDGKIVRPTEEYIKAGEFGIKYRHIDELIKSFQIGGFKMICRLFKFREFFEFQGIKIMLDDVKDLGYFIELSADNKISKAYEIDEFKRRFNLSGRESVGSYIDEYRAKRPDLSRLNAPARDLQKNELNAESQKREQSRNQKIKEIFRELVERDFQDTEINRRNRENLIKLGFIPLESKKRLKIDTGRIEVKDVVEIIKSNIGEDIKIISIDGKSGAGKGAAAKELQKAIHGQLFSMGEVFRYLTYKLMTGEQVSFHNICANLSYKRENNQMCLFDGNMNISRELAKELRTTELENRASTVAAQTQDIVIKFMKKEIERFNAESAQKILIEGRAFSLDFLPGDLRVEFVVDPEVAAERRFLHNCFKTNDKQ